MKVEFQQRAEGGGFPAPNGCGFMHGDAVWIVSNDELAARDALIAELAAVVREYKELADEMFPYVPEYFRDKWAITECHQAMGDRAVAVLAKVPSAPGTKEESK